MTTKKTSQTGKNPILYLFRMLWVHSPGNHGRIVLYWCMFITANTLDYLVVPILMAKLMGMVAQGVTTDTLTTIAIILILKPLTEVGFWMFHGPARVIERLNAFRAKANYRAYC